MTGSSSRNWLGRAFPVLALWLMLSIGLSVQAQGTFVIKDIRLEGLQRISAGTVFNYLPIQVGEEIDEDRTAEAIRTLFKTGFFKDVRIEREDDVLVVFVVERPSIASIEFSGNTDISTEDLENSLQDIDFVTGRAFDRSVFDQVEQQLRRSYFAVGKYGIKLTSTVTPLPRNRVAVNFDIIEGNPATIKKINVVGNQAFEEDDLLDLFNLKTTRFFSFFTKTDQYSKLKLAADLESVRSFYLDRGFINFNIDSTQVSITPDKRDVYITVNITEGDEYFVKEVLLAGELTVDQDDLSRLVIIQQGAVFSRKDVTETSANLTERLGVDGYAFANVNAVPEIFDNEKTVKLTFFIDPGKRVYVRRVNFKGNAKTRDEVLRREMRQLEGAWISTSAVERSKERLQRLGYFEEVNVETPAVAGTTDQVDVDFNVVEAPSGNLVVGAGFSQQQGVVLSTEVTQENFLGTGHRISLSFNTSSSDRNLGFNWLNPYFTQDGVSLGLDAFYRTTDASDANGADYTLDELGSGVTFGIPISEFNTVDLGLGIQNTKFKPGSGASIQVLAFDRVTGGEYNTLTLSAAWSNDTRDSRLLPNKGQLTRLAGEFAVPGLDLSYYKLSARHQQFFPLYRSIIGSIKGEIGYGDGFSDTEILPLTENYFGGGIRSLRGYEANTLGPRDSRNDPLGGDLKVIANFEVILPVPFLEDAGNFRFTSFFDAGNIYGPREDFDVGQFRYSVGVSALWLSPLGPLTLSFAAPLKQQDQDETQPLQFTFGTSF